MLLTKIDTMVEIIGKKKTARFEELGKELKMDPGAIERIARILESAHLVDINYPLNPFSKPTVVLVKAKEQEEELTLSGKKVETYPINDSSGGKIAEVEILFSQEEKRNVYFVHLPRLSSWTRAFLDFIKSETTKNLPLLGVERTQEEVHREMNERAAAVRRLISAELTIDSDALRVLTKIAMDEMYGLGELETLISDPMLEEIILNSAKNPVSVYHRVYGWMKTNIFLKSEEEVENYSSQIARKVGRQITNLTPILDAHLVTGDRANATLYPISTSGNSLTLRLFAREPWSIVKFASDEVHSMSVDMAAMLWQAVHYEMNVIVAGGTASGKTSALNSLVSLIPPYQRVVTIEDTRELVLPTYQWNWIPLATRAPNPEGLGEISMLDLVVNSLRMRPDRIVMGEIRRKKEAEVLFEAMHTGHSVYGTIHADTADQVIKRLVEPPIELPPTEVEDIHLLLVQYRDRRKNIRRTLELAEVMPGAKVPEVNHVYKWRPRTDTFESVRAPNRYVEQMNLHTGFTSKEVADDQHSKATVLQWMTKNKFFRVDDVGRVMKTYYADEAGLVSAVEKGLKPERILGEVAK